MKKKIKIAIFTMLLLPLLFVRVCVSAQTAKGGIIVIDDSYHEVDKDDKKCAAKYDKNFWTAWNKGVHYFSVIDKFYGLYDYYDSNKDVLTLLFVSYYDITYNRYSDFEHPENESYLDSNQYYIDQVEQSFNLTGTNADKFCYGAYTPLTRKESTTFTNGFSIECGVDTEGVASAKISYQKSVTREVNDISYVITTKGTNGRVWSFKANAKSDETRSAFSSVVTQVYYLEKASNYNGETFKAIFDGFVSWDLPVCGWEHYHPSTKDGLNDNNAKLEVSFDYKISI